MNLLNNKQPVAVVGMACRFPGAADLPKFWRLLTDAQCAVSETPSDRWDWRALPGNENEATKCRYGGFLSDFRGFDWRAFRIPPREARYVDPQHRLLLELAWETLQDGALSFERIAGSQTGVFVGIQFADYYREQTRSIDRISPFTITGNDLAFAANRISHFFDLRGPSLATVAGCASSLHAIHIACQSIRSGECETAIAAGVNLLLSADTYIALAQTGGVSPTGRCRAMDAAADGMVPGEGAGAVLLKPLDVAERDGDRIYAVIRGSAAAHPGRTRWIMDVDQAGQEQLVRQALADADVAPADVDYVELHGAGTRAGDPVEAKALGAVIGTQRPAGKPCRIGSVKTNVGHLLAAGSVAHFIKTALMLHHRQLPASLHFERPNPDIPLADLGLSLQAKTEAWPDPGRPRIAGVTSLSFAGASAHVVLEEPPRPARSVRAPALDGWRLMMVSAASESALQTSARQLASFIASSDVALDDLCYSVNVCKGGLAHRLFALGNTAELLCRELGAATTTKVEQPPRVGFLCGSFAPAGRDAAMSVVRAANGALRLAPEDRGLLQDADLLAAATNDETLEDPRVCFSFQVLLYRLLQRLGVDGKLYANGRSGFAVAGYLCGFLDLQQALDYANGGPVPERRLPGDLQRAGWASAEDYLAALGRAELTQLQHDQISDWVCLADRPPTLQAADARVHAPFADDATEATAQTTPQLLRTIGMLYAAGCAIDWRQFSGANPSGMVSLPAYPFDRSDYYLDYRDAAVSAQTSTASVDTLSAPLLGHRLPTGLPMFEDIIDCTRYPQLNDHRARGRVVMPGAWYLGWLRRAARELGIGEAFVVEDLEIASAVVLAEETSSQTLQLAMIPEGEGRYQARFHLAGESAKQTACAMLRAADANVRQPAAAAAPKGHVVDHQSFWEELEKRGLFYGPHYRQLTTVERDGAIHWAKLRDDLADAGYPPLLACDPRVLDACFQLISLALGLPDDGVLLPTGIGKFTVYAERPPRWIRFDSAAQRLEIFDADKRAIAAIEALALTRVAENTIARMVGADDNALAEAIYQLAWVDSEPEAHREVAGRWLAYVGSCEYAEPLVKALVKAGATVDLIAPFETKITGAARQAMVRPTDAASFAKVFADWGEQSWDQLLHLVWPSVTASAEQRTAESLQQATRESCASALHLLQALLNTETVHAERLTFATQGAIPYLPERAVTLEQSPLWGLLRVARLEQPEMLLRSIDLDPAQSDWLPALLAAVVEADDEPQTIYYQGKRLIGRLQRAAVGEQAPVPPALDGEGSYLIIGGLGGLGLIVAQWAARCGVGGLILMGRRAPDAQAQAIVEKIKAAGTRVEIVQGSVTESADVARAIAQVKHSAMPPLRGIIHSAGVARDAVLTGQTWDSFEFVLWPKVVGAWLLHQQGGPDLEAFVLFSSVASLFGNPGQANHAAANAFEDALACYRRGQGHKAQSINWGAWESAGGVADRGLGERLRRRGLLPLSNEVGIAALQWAWTHPLPHVGAIPVDWEAFDQQFGRSCLRPYWSQLIGNKQGQADGRFAELVDAPPEERAELIGGFVESLLLRALGRDDGDSFSRDRPFMEEGVDSLMVVEVRSALAAELQLPLPASLLFQYATVDALSAHLAREFSRTHGAGDEAPQEQQQEAQLDMDAELEALINEALE